MAETVAETHTRKKWAHALGSAVEAISQNPPDPIGRLLLERVVYLCAADKYRRLTHRLSKDQKGL